MDLGGNADVVKEKLGKLAMTLLSEPAVRI